MKCSLLIPVHDSGRELERNLPSMLTQDYDGEYEVIVVDESSTDDSADVMKRLEAEYNTKGHTRMYTTYIPSSSHWLSRRKLSITLGMKAARGEWVVLTDASCKAAPGWLRTMMSHADDDHDMVLGYVNLDTKGSVYRRFRLMYASLFLLRKRTAYRSLGMNLALRKRLFNEHHGFQNNLEWLRGEYDFLVNECASPGRTAIATEEEARLRRDNPPRKVWFAENLFYQETRRHLKRRHSHNLVFDIRQILLRLIYISALTAVIAGCVINHWITAAAGCLALAAWYTLRLLPLCRTARLLGEKEPALLMPIMELCVVWTNLYYKVRHALTDRHNFIRS